ncbi:MAG: helix-hairpin-helix domain-containing protein [Chthoniobacteraceae bacterium]
MPRHCTISSGFRASAQVSGRSWWIWAFRRVDDLRNRSPERLYEQLCASRGQHQDRCVLYTFWCAVYFASEKERDPERLKW